MPEKGQLENDEIMLPVLKRLAENNLKNLDFEGAISQLKGVITGLNEEKRLAMKEKKPFPVERSNKLEMMNAIVNSYKQLGTNKEFRDYVVKYQKMNIAINQDSRDMNVTKQLKSLGMEKRNSRFRKFWKDNSRTEKIKNYDLAIATYANAISNTSAVQKVFVKELITYIKDLAPHHAKFSDSLLKDVGLQNNKNRSFTELAQKARRDPKDKLPELPQPSKKKEQNKGIYNEIG